jgi:hypothetical protein
MNSTSRLPRHALALLCLLALGLPSLAYAADAHGVVGLRRLLKRLGRGYGLRCLRVAEADVGPEDAPAVAQAARSSDGRPGGAVSSKERPLLCQIEAGESL